MIINWYTIFFQIINFMILVFLLRRFLYEPIIAVMDKREQRIVQREKDAAARQEAAAKESRAFRAKTDELQQRTDEILAEARAAAREINYELLEEARREVDNTRRRWHNAFESERETFLHELRRRIGRQAGLIARRCLADLADAKLEDLTWQSFVTRIGALSEEKRSELRQALAADDYELTIHSAFGTDDDQLTVLEAKLHELLPDLDMPLKLLAKTDPALVCGLELETGGYRLAWSVDGYLDNIEEQILKELEQPAAAGISEEVSGGDEPRG
ncbi:MAG: hypothetical protein WD535_03055 [Thermaerobacterales bacterium]